MKFAEQPHNEPSAPKSVETHHVRQVHETIDIPDLHPFYKFAYEDAQKGFKERINMEEFTNRRDLSRDMVMVQEKLARIQETVVHGNEEERMAIVQSDVFEHMLHQHIAHAHWFGEQVKSILPSVYDDLFLGVDLILQENLGRGAFAFSTLAIDATFSPVGAVTKMEKTREQLLRGKLGSIKYFKSEDMNFTGRMDNVPHFTIGVDRQSLFEMVKEYVQKGASPGVNTPSQKTILEQIATQAEYYGRILKEHGFTKEADTYLHIGEKVSAILQGLPEVTRKEPDDVHKAIIAFCENREQS